MVPLARRLTTNRRARRCIRCQGQRTLLLHKSRRRSLHHDCPGLVPSHLISCQQCRFGPEQFLQWSVEEGSLPQEHRRLLCRRSSLRFCPHQRQRTSAVGERDAHNAPLTVDSRAYVHFSSHRCPTGLRLAHFGRRPPNLRGRDGRVCSERRASRFVHRQPRRASGFNITTKASPTTGSFGFEPRRSLMNGQTRPSKPCAHPPSGMQTLQGGSTKRVPISIKPWQSSDTLTNRATPNRRPPPRLHTPG